MDKGITDLPPGWERQPRFGRWEYRKRSPKSGVTTTVVRNSHVHSNEWYVIPKPKDRSAYFDSAEAAIMYVELTHG